MKKVGAFLLILLCVLTCVITTLGDYLYSAVVGQTDEETAGNQYALSMDENGIVYYIENVGGVNHIVKVDDQGNLIVDEELPVLTDADRFVVQNIYVTSDNYIYVAGFEMDMVNRQALRAVLVALDENGSLYGTPLDRTIVPEGVRAPRASAMFAAMSENDDRVYFAYLNEGQAEILAHEKSDGSVTTVANVNVGDEITAMYVTTEGRLVAANADGVLRLSTADGARMEVLSVGRVQTFRMYHGSGNTFYYLDAQTGGVGQVNLAQDSVSTIVSGEMDLDGGRVFSDFAEVAVGARGQLAGMLYDDNYVVYTGSESRMTASPAARRSSFDTGKLVAVAILLGALLLTVLIWDIYCNVLKMRVAVLVRQAVLIGISLIILVYVLLQFILLPQMESAMTVQYEHQVSTAGRVLAAEVQGLDEESRGQAVRSAQISVLGSDGEEIPVYFSLLRLDGSTKRLEATNESDVSGVTCNAIPLGADLNSAMERALSGTEVLVRVRDPLGENMYALISAGENLVVVAGMNAENVGASLTQLFTRIQIFLVAACAVLFAALLAVESLTVRSLQRLRRGVDAVSAGNYDVTINVTSGDEVENLAHAFTAMAHKIRDNTKRLEDVSRSYYRFVPENLVQLLGETSIEKVGKSSSVEKEMTLLRMHFTFADARVSHSTKELFRNINNVIEHLSPVVTENAGTIYDFGADSFIAVFARSDDALRAALRIREAAEVLDADRKAQGMCAVDVRLVLCGGDVMLGIIGDEKRMAPAVVSDVVSMSERLGALQRPSSVYILCTQDVVRDSALYRMRCIGEYFDGGRKLTLYDVYDGDPYALLKLKETIQPQFVQALAAYESGDMNKARLLFLQIVKSAFDDGVSRNYLYCADAHLHGNGAPGYRTM
ncbi:MAG: adenylate/guanylate cyclase domain-containing protein [Candidatus Spyradocola sp.]